MCGSCTMMRRFRISWSGILKNSVGRRRGRSRSGSIIGIGCLGWDGMGISDPGICMHRVTDSLAYYDGKEQWRIREG